MFVGHEFLAFALVGWGARRLGRGKRESLSLGGVAALAALLPDLDVAYAAATYALAVADGAPLGWEAFWGVANGVHRVATHPLPVGVAAALVFGAAAAAFRGRGSNSGTGRALRVGLAACVALASAAAVVRALRDAVSPSAAAVAAAFLACVGVAGAAVGRRAGSSPRALTAAAGVGFLTHPFGDVFLAAPPPLLSPFGPPPLVERVSLAADPTLDLLAVLSVEVAAVWAGVAVFARLSADRFGRPRRLRDAVDPRAALGVAYAGAAFVLPRPTVADAHVLGFTVVPLAALVAVWAGRAERSRTASSGRGPARPAALGEAGVEVGSGVEAEVEVESGSDAGNDDARPASGAPTAVDAAYVGLVTGLATLTAAAVGYAVAYSLA